MDDRLKQDERSRVEVTPLVERGSRGNVATRPPAGLLVLVTLLAVAVAWLAWEKWGPQEEGDIVASAMIAFERQNQLTVFSSRFDVVAESVSTPSVGPFPVDALQSRQAMIVPATVEYRLDFAGMDRSDFAWDEASQTLDVELPELEVSAPNIDESQARYFTEGVWVSRDASQSLSRNNSAQAQRRALSFAENPEVMSMARSAARAAVRQNLAIPLQVAGFGDVTVNVRFEDEQASLPESAN